MSTMPIRSRSALAAVFALSLGLGVSGCGDLPNNRTLYSVKQPVVERSNFTLDLTAGAGGLAVPEQHRLADWFKTMDLGYGDRVAIDFASNRCFRSNAMLAAESVAVTSRGVRRVEEWSTTAFGTRSFDCEER